MWFYCLELVSCPHLSSHVPSYVQYFSSRVPTCHPMSPPVIPCPYLSSHVPTCHPMYPTCHPMSLPVIPRPYLPSHVPSYVLYFSSLLPLHHPMSPNVISCPYMSSHVPYMSSHVPYLSSHVSSCHLMYLPIFTCLLNPQYVRTCLRISLCHPILLISPV